MFVERRSQDYSIKRANARARRGIVTFQTQTGRIHVIAALNGVPTDVARARLQKGWSVNQTFGELVSPH